MFAARTGQCRGYNTATNIATPFVRRSCFEPCFLTPLNDIHSETPKTFYGSHLNITNNDRSIGFDTAYGSGISDPVNPLKVSPWDSRNALWRREGSVVVGYAPRNYTTPNGQTCPQQPLRVVAEDNVERVVCPILTSYTVQPQCATALNTVWQCERFAEVDPVAYQKCREYQRMLHYQVQTPDGTLIPVAVEMTDEGFDAYHAAVQKAGVACASCQVKYPDLDNIIAPSCVGPNYTAM